MGTAYTACNAPVPEGLSDHDSCAMHCPRACIVLCPFRRRQVSETSSYQIMWEEPMGVTDYSMKFLENRLSSIGKVRDVVIYADEKQGAYRTFFMGTHGEICVTGFSCGYGGTGPNGLRKALELVKFRNMEEAWKTILTPKAEGKAYRIWFYRDGEIKVEKTLW